MLGIYDYHFDKEEIKNQEIVKPKWKDYNLEIDPKTPLPQGYFPIGYSSVVKSKFSSDWIYDIFSEKNCKAWDKYKRNFE